MSLRPPPLDERTAAKASARLTGLLQESLQKDPTKSLPADPLREALVGIASRFAELVIARLNQVPEKNFLAFLDLLGASQLPPQPARAPLTFSLAVGGTASGVVPAGTQVAAPPLADEKDPVLFETEAELVVLPVRLSALFSRDAVADRYEDLGALATEEGAQGLAVFAPATAVDHRLYLGFDEVLAFPRIERFTLQFDLEERADARTLAWEAWNGSTWSALAPLSDTTQGLRIQGAVVLPVEAAVPPSQLAGTTSRWLRCSLRTTVTSSSQADPRRVRASELPTISKITATVTVNRNRLPLDAAFANTASLDVSRPFLPFGELPRLGDTFFLRCDEAFSAPGAKVTLHFQLGQVFALRPVPTAAPAPTPTPAPQPDPTSHKLRWETWDGTDWAAIGQDADGTNAFTKGDEQPSDTDPAKPWGTGPGAGRVTFTTPAKPMPVSVNGVSGHWIRVRIEAGNFDPARIVPLLLARVRVDYQCTRSAAPQALVAFNERTLSMFAPARGPVTPFRSSGEAQPTVYLGFTLDNAGSFPNRPLTLYVRTADRSYSADLRDKLADAAPAAPAQLAWEYWNGAWTSLRVSDDTQAFTRTGLLQFLAPPDLVAREDFGLQACHWVRARWAGGAYALEPRLNRVLPNTAMAAQATVLRDELLGSSDGSRRQRFATTRAPVLPGQWLEVREPELPSAGERSALVAEEGADAIRTEAGQPGVWVRWHEVPDFHGSDPRARHYVVDRLQGAILFGDGRNGLVPPIGINNLRLAQYRTGGGLAGNRPAGAITQLRTTLPYVDKVRNYEPAIGGSDPEPLQEVADRVPRQVRHGGRAVTVEDYADLARQASPEVARSVCVAPAIGPSPDAGRVRVIVVPRSADPRPVPSMELVRRVQDYLDARRCATARVLVTGPEYLVLSITVKVAPVSPAEADRVVLETRRRLLAFLHPLTGGVAGIGWAFGIRPRELDFRVLLAGIPGLDHVNSLVVDTKGDDEVIRSRRFLVSAGSLDVRAV
jgi:predicted phage baseplate assembly protein